MTTPGAGAGARQLARHVFDRLDPTLTLARRRARAQPPLVVALVYRQRNAATVQALLATVPGARVALWALDSTAESLAASTVGEGPGSRFALLNRLVGHLQPQPEEWLVIADDDVAMTTGTFGLAAAIGVTIGLSLLAPAHSRESHISWSHTRRQPLTLARECAYVEIGPVVLLDAQARALAIPFPESGMGWGVELHWADLRDRGLRLGIVDAVTIEHLVPPHGAYDTTREQAALDAELAARGLDERGLHALMQTTRLWRPWRAPA